MHSVLISYIVKFETKSMSKDKEEYFIMIVSINQKEYNKSKCKWMQNQRLKIYKMNIGSYKEKQIHNYSGRLEHTSFST